VWWKRGIIEWIIRIKIQGIIILKGFRNKIIQRLNCLIKLKGFNLERRT